LYLEPVPAFAAPPVLSVKGGINKLTVTLGHSDPQADRYEVYYKKGAGLSAEEILAGYEGVITLTPPGMIRDIAPLIAGEDYSLVAAAKKAGYADSRSAPVTGTVMLLLDLTPPGASYAGYWTWDGPANTYAINTFKPVLVIASGGQEVNKAVSTTAVVRGAGTYNITMKDVGITTSSGSPFYAYGAVNLTLEGTNTLTSAAPGGAGLAVPPDDPDRLFFNSLVIGGEGTLYAYGGNSTGSGGAGIGGSYMGALTINSGTVFAAGGNGSSGGAGIGGRAGGPGGVITITGGTVTATGGSSTGVGEGSFGGGAGIGSGGAVNYFNTTSGMLITISGGTVTAIGGKASPDAKWIEGGAGIGGGNRGSSGGITISGGVVTASGGERAAGIGGGVWGNVSDNITITAPAAGRAVKGANGLNDIGRGAGSNPVTSPGTVSVTAPDFEGTHD
jgi:hypothetical protein